MQQGYSYSSDYYALGVIGYELMQGNRPYYTGNNNQYKDLILIYQPRIKTTQMKKGWSENSRDFINKLLQRRPVKRLGYSGIREIKNHAWMKDINWELLKNKKIRSPYIPKEGKEYYDKKYCLKDSNDNNKLINVKGYQHVFKNYAYINLDYVSQFIDINKKNDKNEKEVNNEKKKILYSDKNKFKYFMHTNKSTSYLKLNQYDRRDSKRESKMKDNKNNKHYVKTKKNEKHTSLNDIKNNNFLYNSSSFLNRYYDLGISDRNEDKKRLNDKNYKNISCHLSERKLKEKENKKNINSKENKKFKDLNLFNKYSKKLDLSKSKTHRFTCNKTTNNDNEQNVYSTTKKARKEKTSNILTEHQKKEGSKNSINKINVMNNYTTKNKQKNNIKKNIINKTSKHVFSKSQIINFKEKKNSLKSPIIIKNNNKIKKHDIKISTPIYNARKVMSDINIRKSKRYISKSIREHHIKSMSNLQKEKIKQNNNNINRKDEKASKPKKQKLTNKKANIQKIEKPLIKNKVKKKISDNESNKIRILKFDDYFRNTGLIKDSNKNSFFVLDKFKSI